MKKFVVFLMVLVFFIQFVGCAGMNINPADLKTPHARGRFINVTYIMAYNDHVRYANLPNLRPEAKELLNAKRAILIELADPFSGPITIFNHYIETGQLITDAIFNGLLDRLLEMETGWYTDSRSYISSESGASVQSATGEQSDSALRKAIYEAGLVGGEPIAQFDPILMGALIELLRTGIHAIQAMLQQRGLDETQMAEAYQKSLVDFRALNPTNLKILE